MGKASAPFYNAVIRDHSRKIIARTKLTTFSGDKDKSRIWRIKYAGRRICSKDIGQVLSDPLKPIIITAMKPADRFRLMVKHVPLDGKVLQLMVSSDCTVEDLKYEIAEEGGPLADDLWLHYDGRRLEDSHTLLDYNIQPSSTIDAMGRLRGGGAELPSLSMHDLEGKCVTGVGTPAQPEDKWKSFSFGLNIIGRCDNPDCKSTQQPQDLAVLQMYYTSGMLVPSNSIRSPCFVCHTGNFKPSNFLVAGGKAEFGFKKLGEDEVRRVQIESGPFPEFIKFSEGNEKVDYAIIEVTVIPLGLDKSIVCCADCGDWISKSEVENQEDRICGHVFHKQCLEKYYGCQEEPDGVKGNTDDCPVCRTDFVDNGVEEILRQLEANGTVVVRN